MYQKEIDKTKGRIDYSGYKIEIEDQCKTLVQTEYGKHKNRNIKIEKRKIKVNSYVKGK